MGACFSVSRCFLKLGEWQLNLQGINESTIPKVLQYYSAATEHDRSWYKVTQRWSRLCSRPRHEAPSKPSTCQPACAPRAFGLCREAAGHWSDTENLRL